MSNLGEPCNWEEMDSASFGEGIARCARLDCCAPLRMVVGPTVIVLRCDHAGHIQSIHSIVEPAWTSRA